MSTRVNLAICKTQRGEFTKFSQEISRHTFHATKVTLYLITFDPSLDTHINKLRIHISSINGGNILKQEAFNSFNYFHQIQFKQSYSSFREHSRKLGTIFLNTRRPNIRNKQSCISHTTIWIFPDHDMQTPQDPLISTPVGKEFIAYSNRKESTLQLLSNCMYDI